MRRLAAFYLALGWEDLVPEYEDYFQFRLTGLLLALWPLEQATAELGVRATAGEGVFRGVTLAINVERAEEVQPVLEAAREAGALRVVDAEDQEWGGRSGHFFDPEGNAWEVAWNPALGLDDRGLVVTD